MDPKEYRRAYYLAHRDEALAYSREWRLAHRDEKKAYLRAYNATHRDKQRAKARAHYAMHRERIRQKAKDAYRANPDKYRAQAASYRTPDKQWAAMLRWRYGLSVEDYSAMLNKQDGVCAICQQTETARESKRLSVDHDHSCCSGPGKTCGKCIRGLLCHHCNATLGHLEKMLPNLDWPAEAVRYRSQYRKAG